MIVKIKREPREFSVAFRDQPVCCGFDVIAYAAEELVFIQPGRIGGRNSTTIVPGFRMNARRGQNRPELSATGTQGTPI